MEDQRKIHHFPDIPKGILGRKSQGRPTAESRRLETIKMRQAEATAGQQVSDASSGASILPILRASDDPADFPLNDARDPPEVYEEASPEVAALIRLKRGYEIDYQSPPKSTLKYLDRSLNKEWNEVYSGPSIDLPSVFDKMVS